jgi:thiol:disulfide interchange protein DsbA
MNRRDALQQLGVLALFASPASLALAQQEKARFTLMKPVVPSDVEGKKIEVIEFFHYGCNHCRNFDPLLAQWLKKLPDDVAFKRIPAIWGQAALRSLALLHYTLSAVKQIDRLHEKIFAAVQDDRVDFSKEDALRAWVEKQGVDVKTFMSAYRSFGVQAQVNRADQLARAYKIDGVPMMAVAGRFTTSAGQTGGHAGMLTEVDSLIGRVRRG